LNWRVVRRLGPGDDLVEMDVSYQARSANPPGIEEFDVALDHVELSAEQAPVLPLPEVRDDLVLLLDQRTEIDAERGGARPG
jgi:hypothetical protein